MSTDQHEGESIKEQGEQPGEVFADEDATTDAPARGAGRYDDDETLYDDACYPDVLVCDDEASVVGADGLFTKPLGV